jgi:uncharacterized protein (TIGR00661 family)
MNFLFLVQGEGRGHMTQAIVLSRLLRANGHQIVHTFIGKSKRRSIPEYFFKQMDADISELDSPNFVLDEENKSLKLGKSIGYNARFLKTYKKSLDQIHQKVQETIPDAIVNFYDFLGGFYFRIYNPVGVKHICIGRQFLSLHPSYPFVKGRKIEKKLFMANNAVTSQKCDLYLALSFRPYKPDRIDNLVVVPPLINHEEVDGESTTEDFILAYMVNDGYAEEVIYWHSRNPEVKVHCFWDRKNMPETYVPQKNLTFHQINNALFKDMLRRCKGYISTAGFESICEAMHLGKPVMMVPVESQYEQACNALDGELAGAGIIGSSFDISRLLDYLPKHSPSKDFRRWSEQATAIFLAELTNFK